MQWSATTTYTLHIVCSKHALQLLLQQAHLAQLLRCRDRWWVGSKMNAPCTWQEEQSQKLWRIELRNPAFSCSFCLMFIYGQTKKLYKSPLRLGVIGVYCVKIKQPCSLSCYNHRKRKANMMKFWDKLVRGVSLSCQCLEVFTRRTKRPDRHHPPLLSILKTPQQPLSASSSTILSFKILS